MRGVTDDLPADVATVLAQLFDEGQAALDGGDPQTARESVTTAETVVTNKLPEGPLREQFLHGCARTRRLLDSDEDVEPEAAAEYLAAMARRLPEED